MLLAIHVDDPEVRATNVLHDVHEVPNINDPLAIRGEARFSVGVGLGGKHFQLAVAVEPLQRHQSDCIAAPIHQCSVPREIELRRTGRGGV